MSTEPEAIAAPSAAPKAKQENILHNLLLNILLPVTVLSMCSKEGNWYSLGPKWALIVAILFPVGYFIYDYLRRKKINVFSIIGIVSVLFTGGLGLLDLSPHVFGIKEAAVPLIFASLFWWSGRGAKPLIRLLLMNPEMVDVPKVEAALKEKDSGTEFDRLLRSSNWTIIFTFLGSAVLNYFVSIYFLEGHKPGSPDYSEAIGRQMLWSWVIIAVPSLAMMIFAMIRLFKGVKRLTGLDMDHIMLPR